MSVVLALVAGLLAVRRRRVSRAAVQPGRTAAAARADPAVRDGARDPGVAVDEDGTAHIAWWEDRDEGAVTVYCRLPRGATACDRREEFDASAHQSGPIDVVLRPDGTLYVLSFDIFDTVARRLRPTVATASASRR